MTTSPDYLDTVFDALTPRERRYSLQYIHGDDGDVTALDDVASYLSAATGQDRTETMTGLIHNHLPKLADAGFIDYDRRISSDNTDTAIVDTIDPDDDRILLDYLADTLEQDDGYLDDIFPALASAESRQALYVLENEQDRRSTLIGMANYLAPASGGRGQAITRLHTVALPRLEEYGWVQYDPTTQKITLDVDPDEERDQLFLQYLEKAYDEESGPRP
jgi:hypothetical protein